MDLVHLWIDNIKFKGSRYICGNFVMEFSDNKLIMGSHILLRMETPEHHSVLHKGISTHDLKLKSI